MRRLLVGMLIFMQCTAWSFSAPAKAADTNGVTAPVMNLFFGYKITEEDAKMLARWDIVVLDMDETYHFPERIAQIRRINPNIKLLAYVSSGEIADARYRVGRGSPGQKLAESISESWFLGRPGVSRISWWPGAWLMNASDKSPLVNGKRWNTFLGPFIRDELMSTGVWDGVFLDGSYSEVTSKFGAGLDIDRDGKADSSQTVDAEYKKGMRKLIKNVKQAIGPSKIVMVNSSLDFADTANGILFENFPQYGWAVPFQQMREVIQKNKQPVISAFNTNTKDKERPNDYRLMRYGLSSALVAGAHFSFDAGAANHHRTWWYDEYEASIGAPAKAAESKQGIWVREYTTGYVAVNPTKKAVTITLPGSYERINGNQDRNINNGQVVRTISVPPEDGVILLKRGDDGLAVNDAIVTDGQFYQVLDNAGKKKRNGFFADDARVPGGSPYIITDVDSDGKRDLVYTSKGKVFLQLANGTKREFTPYRGFTGNLNFVVGQMDRDTPHEIAVVQASGAVPQVKVFDIDAKERFAWYPYSRSFKGGASIALGDWDGDGLREIVVAAGFGGGPHIRSYKTDGKDWRGSFFAYPAAQRAGAFIALGDIEADGKAELLVGSGPGLPPSVRLFDAKQQRVSEVVIGNAPVKDGVQIRAADLDGDGKAELLVPSSPF